MKMYGSEQLNIYPTRARAFKKEEVLLKNAIMSDANRDLIIRFQDYLFSKNVREVRVAKLSAQLRKLIEWMDELDIKKTLSDLKYKDLTRLISHINRLDALAPATKSDYRRCLKQFFKWHKYEDERFYEKDELLRRDLEKMYNYILNDVSVSYPEADIDPSTIIKDEDIRLVIEKGARTPKEKAFLDLLQETGARIGEFLNLRIKDIVFDKDHAKVLIPYGKTGSRQVFILRSIPTLKKYLDVHPLKDPDSYLWLSDSPKTRNQPLMHGGTRKMVSECFKRANLNKKCNLHWFRHSRATILAPKLTEAVLCKYMGWSTGSKQVRKYVHLCTAQVEDAFLGMYDLTNGKKPKETTIKCVCGTINPLEEKYCHKCYQPLRLETIMQEKEILHSETNKSIQLLMEISKNPDLMAKFNEFKNSMNNNV